MSKSKYECDCPGGEPCPIAFGIYKTCKPCMHYVKTKSDKEGKKNEKSENRTN